jgi:hypothetical protein
MDEIYPQKDIPPAHLPADATTRLLPEVVIGQESDDSPDSTAYGDTHAFDEIGTGVVGIDEHLTVDDETGEATDDAFAIAHRAGAVAVPATSDDPRERPVTARIPGETSEVRPAGDDTEVAPAQADTPTHRDGSLETTTYEEYDALENLSHSLGGGWSDMDGMIEFADMPEGEEIDRVDTPESFEPYREQYERIDAQLAADVDPDDIEGYVSSGGVSHVYKTPDGNLIKLPGVVLEDENDLPDPPPPATIHTDYVEPLEGGKGGAHLEQLVTFTEEGNGAVIVETAPGTTIDKLTKEDLDNIPIAHHEDLMDACIDLRERHLWPDCAAQDLMYDPEESYTVIDYNTLEHVQAQYDSNRYKDPDAHRDWDAPEMARYLGSLYVFLRHSREGELLPQAGRNYYQAYRNRFGNESAQQLLVMWRDEGLIIPDDL